jgi:HAE1 family hydrophobic/amphiphilic exporter-1
MNMFGFTINMITLMALSLCVGLLIDDAIVVRENIVRHVQMGKDAFQAALDGTQEIGLAVLATTLSIVAVFLPIGFMGGIIGKFFHEFGITIVAAVLISMFVSFTLDPMLSSHLARPQHRRARQATAGTPVRQDHRPRHRLVRPRHRRLADGYQGILRWSLGTSWPRADRAGHLRRQRVHGAAAGHRIRAQGRLLGDHAQLLHAGGLVAGGDRGQGAQVEAIVREFPEVRYTLSTINTGNAQGKIYASIYVRLVDRKDRSRSVDQMSGVLRERLQARCPASPSPMWACWTRWAATSRSVLAAGPDLGTGAPDPLVMEKVRDIPGLVDLDSSVKPTSPRSTWRSSATSPPTWAWAWARSAPRCAPWWPADGGQLARQRRPDLRRERAPGARARATRRTGPGAPALHPDGSNADGSTRIVRLNQVATVREGHRRQPDQPARPDARGAVTANVAGSLGRRGVQRHPHRAGQRELPPGYRYQFSGSTKNMAESFGYAISALVLAIIFIYMILASQFKSFLQPLALMTSLPLTLIGVVLALMMFRSTLSMFSIIGVVMLMGLVTKNAILLVDFAIRAARTASH